MKVHSKEIYEESLYSWEDSYGTDCLFYSERYKLTLPYWVEYMPEPEKSRYINQIAKCNDFKNMENENS